MPLDAGQKLGSYEVISPIGKGGMGEVFRARDTKLDRDVAIKVLPEEFASDEERVERFEREAKLLASLNHPNIASIHGFEDSDGVKALVLELVEGPTLAERIAQGPIPIDEAIAIARQIADALEAGHETGVVHRDLKPANVKIKPDGTVKVLDYGLAKALEHETPARTDGELSQSPTLTRQSTRVGVILGTAAYMSPEQAKGKPVDKRADIWSFGAVVYEMLVGRRAFEGEDVSDTLAAVLRAEPDWNALPGNVPATFRHYLTRCLERDPKRRVRDIGDLRLAMDGVFDVASGPAESVARSRHWLPWALAAALAAILAVWSPERSGESEVTRFAYHLPAEHQLRGSSFQAKLAVSRDGRHFVYNTMTGIYLRSMDELEARVLPATESMTGGWTGRDVFFSADGRTIVYVEGEQLKGLALNGGAPVVFSPTSETRGGFWADDDTIFFAPVREGVVRVDNGGGTPELAVPAAEGELLGSPRLLPDGDTLLVTVRKSLDRSSVSRIEAVSLATGERTTLVDAGSDASYVSTGHLLYAFEEALYAVSFDVNALQVTSGAVLMVPGLSHYRNGGSANYAVSDDGTLFFLTDEALDQGLAWVDRTGDVEMVETIPAERFVWPRLSPDGKRVLTVAQGDVRIYDLATGRESRLTTDGATIYVGWTPAGDAVTYTSSRGSLEGEIWMQPSDGSGEARKLTSLGGRVDFDQWAPDGRTFAAHHHVDGTTNVLMVSFDGDTATPETWLEREYANDTAVFSPDGRYVAFLASQTGKREVYIRPFPGPGGQTPVSVGGGIEPAWAPSGEIFYRRPGDYMMMAVEVETDPSLRVGAPVELFAGRVRGSGVSPTARYSVSPDGQRFLMSAGMTQSEDVTGTRRGPRVVVVQNWVNELEERLPN